MSDYCLDVLGVEDAAVVKGAFSENPHFAPPLATLQAGVDEAAESAHVIATDDTSDTTCGGWLLHRREGQVRMQGRAAQPLQLALAVLRAYRQR